MPEPHLLQGWEWGEIKSRFGWQPEYKQWHGSDGSLTAAAMIMTRTVSLGGFRTPLKVMYVPRGPLLDWHDTQTVSTVLTDLANLAAERHAVWLKIDPEAVIACGEDPANSSQVGALPGLTQTLPKLGWHYSANQVQFKNSVWIDLSRPLDEIIAGFKQKTRYNIRLAQKKGVTVRVATAQDFEALYTLYAHTAGRDGFIIRSKAYYLQLWTLYLNAGLLTPLVAEVEGSMIGGLFLFHQFARSWYLYGMSGAEHRDKMPNHLLQWEAIRHAKAEGCLRYDMWGAPDHFSEQDRMWGVYRFKEGFSGQVVRTLGAWDYAPNKGLYFAFEKLFPAVLAYFRRGSRQDQPL